MNNRLKQIVFLLAAIALCGVCCSVADACPTCKDSLAESDVAGKAMAAGYFYSILFMMSMPFVIIGTFGSAAYVSMRRARREEQDTP